MSTPGEGESLEVDFEPAGRVLCPDGGCIGVIGADGRCKVCGTAAPAGTDLDAVRHAESEPGKEALHMESFEGEGLRPEDDGGPTFDEQRQLCPDGGCIGVIGDDGRCKECGRAADSSV